MASEAEQSIDRKPLVERELLVPERGVHLEAATERHAVAVTGIYRAAYERGDFFAGRYADPEHEIFDPAWLAGDFDNPDHQWFVFTDDAGEVIGVSGFFHDADAGETPVWVSDETQVDPRGRGMNVMDRFFRRVVPQLQAEGAQLATEFVLTPESKGLRRTLQTGLGMTALGIRPHALRHPDLGVTRTEIVAASFRDLEPRPADLVLEFANLYRIVMTQFPERPKPRTEWPELNAASPFADRYEEASEPVSADDPAAQRAALEAGFRPVVFDPQRHEFTVARFPAEDPELGFIIDGEGIPVNVGLVRYLRFLQTGSVQRF